MKARFILPIVVAVVALASLGFRFWYYRGAGGGHEIRLSGNIEVVDAQLGFKIPGRVVARPVDEGYLVKKGDLIAQLDTSDLECEVSARAAELAVAQAALAELLAGSRVEEIASAEAAMNRYKAMLDELVAGSRPQEIAVAEATLASAQADQARMETEHARALRLRDTNAIAAEEYDRIRASYEVAAARVREAAQRLDLTREGPRLEAIQQARAAYHQAQAQYELVKAGPRKEDIEQGRAKVEQAKSALELAKVKLSYARLESPTDGVVLSKNIEPGEYVSPGTPVVTVADMVNIWLRGYVSETQMDQVKVGQKARVTTDTKPGKVYEGRVSFIASQAEFTPKTVQTPQERVKLVFRVKIDIDNRNMELKPGMPADAVILVDQPAELPAAN